jgi:hypothetical protein
MESLARAKKDLIPRATTPRDPAFSGFVDATLCVTVDS